MQKNHSLVLLGQAVKQMERRFRGREGVVLKHNAFPASWHVGQLLGQRWRKMPAGIDAASAFCPYGALCALYRLICVGLAAIWPARGRVFSRFVVGIKRARRRRKKTFSRLGLLILAPHLAKIERAHKYA